MGQKSSNKYALMNTSLILVTMTFTRLFLVVCFSGVLGLKEKSFTDNLNLFIFFSLAFNFFIDHLRSDQQTDNLACLKKLNEMNV